jgi:hypothetical protein
MTLVFENQSGVCRILIFDAIPGQLTRSSNECHQWNPKSLFEAIDLLEEHGPYAQVSFSYRSGNGDFYVQAWADCVDMQCDPPPDEIKPIEGYEQFLKYLDRTNFA